MQEMPKNMGKTREPFHVCVCRQLDRIGRSLEQGRDLSSQVLFLKNLLYPFWHENEEFQEQWDEVKKKLGKMSLPKQQKLNRLRQEQLNLLIGLAWEHDVLQDSGVEFDSVEELQEGLRNEE